MRPLERVALLLRSRGFSVEEGVERLRGFGGLVERLYVAGYKGGVKLRVTETPGGAFRVTVLVVGGDASREVAESLEHLGGSVDYDESLGRVLAVFKSVGVEVVEAVVGRLP